MDFDFKAVVDDIEAVPENLRELYEEGHEGAFVLKTSVLQGHPALVNVKATADRIDKQKRDLEKRLTEAEERAKAVPDDFDAEEWERLKGLESGDDPPKRKGGEDPEKVKRAVEQTREKLERKHADEMKVKDERIAVLTAQINRSVVDGGLSKALSEGGVAHEYMAAAKALLREKGIIKLVEDDGNFDAVADTDMGETPLVKFVSDWLVTDEGKPFIKPARGADAKGSNGIRGSEPNPWKSDTFNLTAQGRLISQDRAKAERLMRSAGLPDQKIRAYLP